MRPPVASIEDNDISIIVPRGWAIDYVKPKGFLVLAMPDWHLPFLNKERGVEELQTAIVVLEDTNFAHKCLF